MLEAKTIIIIAELEFSFVSFLFTIHILYMYINVILFYSQVIIVR